MFTPYLCDNSIYQKAAPRNPDYGEPYFCYWMGLLFNDPGFAGHEHVTERAEAFLRRDFSDQCRDFFIVDRGFDVADHAYGQRQIVSVHKCELAVKDV